MSDTDSWHGWQVSRCASISFCSFSSSSPVRRASMRVNTALHCMGDSSGCQRLAQKLQRAEDFAAKHRLVHASRFGNVRVRHLLHEAEDDQLADLWGQFGDSAVQFCDLFAFVELRSNALLRDKGTDAIVVERGEGLFELTGFSAPAVVAEVSDDPEQPGSQGQVPTTIRRVLAGQGFMSAHECVLDHFLRVKRILKQLLGEVEERALVEL